MITGCASTGGKGSSTAQYQVLQAQETGDSLYVACRNLPLHKRPDGYSEADYILGFGTKVEVLDVAGFYKISADSDEEIPAWAQISVDNKLGYAASRCLVTLELLQKQGPIKAGLKAKRQTVSVASKGFSEEEEGDLFFMMGARGQAQGGDANYKEIDVFLRASQEYNPRQAYIDFRRQGQLGEFQ